MKWLFHLYFGQSEADKQLVEVFLKLIPIIIILMLYSLFTISIETMKHFLVKVK